MSRARAGALAGLLLLLAPLHLAAERKPGEPRLFAPGVISGPGNEFGGSMTPDGLEVYFSRSVPRSYMYAIFVSHKVDGTWRPPQVVSFSGRGRDFDPVLSPDGRTMVFISDRPVRPGEPKRDYDVWMTHRAPDGSWEEPRNAGEPVNSARPAGKLMEWSANEWFASLAADGTLYVAADGYEPDGRMQIYSLPLVEGRYGPPRNLGPEINGGGFENGEPIVAPDQSFLLFASHERKGGFGGWDIYISRRAPGGSWEEPENLGPLVNGPARDYSARLEPDGHTILFTSERNFSTGRTTPLSWADLSSGLASDQNGDGNLYEVDLCALQLRSFKCP